MPYESGLNGVTPKGPWGDFEIDKVKGDEHIAAPDEYWIHVHGPTPDQALAAAQTYLDRNGLKGIVFEMGKSSMVSRDHTDKDSLGCFFRLEPVDTDRAHKFCSELHAGTGASIWDNEPMDESDPYDPDADRAFLEYLNQPARGPRPI